MTTSKESFWKTYSILPYSAVPYYATMPTGEKLAFSNPGAGFQDKSFKSLMTINTWMEGNLFAELVKALYRLFNVHKEIKDIEFSSTYKPINDVHSYLNQHVLLTINIGENRSGLLYRLSSHFLGVDGRITIDREFVDSMDKHANRIKASRISPLVISQASHGIFELLQKLFDRQYPMPFIFTGEGYQVTRKEIIQLYADMRIDRYQDLEILLPRKRMMVPWQLHGILHYYSDKYTGESVLKGLQSERKLSSHSGYTKKFGTNPWNRMRAGEWRPEQGGPLTLPMRYVPSMVLIKSLFEILEMNEKANLLLTLTKAKQENPQVNILRFLEGKGCLLDHRYPISRNFLSTGYIHEMTARIMKNPDLLAHEMDTEWYRLHESYDLVSAVDHDIAGLLL